MKILIFLPLVLLFSASWFFDLHQVDLHPHPSRTFGPGKIRGVCWEATRDSTHESYIQSLKNHHVNWISQTPFGWQREYNQPSIAFHGSRGMWGERDVGLAHTAKVAREKGIKTLLKPHIWLTRANGKWRSDIEMDSPEEWQHWFEQYEDFILHHAELAEAHGFEGLCIGTELYIASTQHEKEWRNIIANIRKVYSGQLTYAANFYKEYEEIQFWDALDFIGVQAYFPLTDSNNPSLKELKEGWKPHYRSLKQLSKKWDKPIVFTEAGYRSSRDAGIRPWEWEKRGEVPKEEISHRTQALCYQAMLETFWKEEWMAGIFFWKWTREIYRKEEETGRRRNRRSPLSFTPKDQALKLIKEWYAK